MLGPRHAMINDVLALLAISLSPFSPVGLNACSYFLTKEETRTGGKKTKIRHDKSIGTNIYTKLLERLKIIRDRVI